jgi:hypothetical protein
MQLAIRQFARNVGHMSGTIKSAADTFHAAYKTATPEQQKHLRKEWMLGHLEGQGVKDSERVFSLGKGKGVSKASVLAIDRASSDFRYYVVRPVKAAKPEPKAMRLSAEARAAAKAYLAQFDNVADAIKALRVVAK